MTSSFVLCNHLPYCLVKTGGLIEEFKQDLESRELHQSKMKLLCPEIHNYRKLYFIRTLEMLVRLAEKYYELTHLSDYYIESNEQERNEYIFNEIQGKMFRLLNRNSEVIESIYHNHSLDPTLDLIQMIENAEYLMWYRKSRLESLYC